MIEHVNALLYSCFSSKPRVISSSKAKDPIGAYCWVLLEGLGLSKASWCWNLRLQIHDGQQVPTQRSLHHWAQIQLLHVTLHTSKAPQFSVQRCWSSWLQATAASKGSAELDQCRWLVLNTKLSPCSLDLLSILWFKTPGSSSSLHLEDSMFPPGSWDLYMWNGQAAALCACT